MFVEFLLPGKSVSEQHSLPKTQQLWVFATRTKNGIETYPDNFNAWRTFGHYHMDVSENNGTPKSSTLIGFSIINHPFWGIPIFGNTYIYLEKNSSLYQQLGYFSNGLNQMHGWVFGWNFLKTPDAPRLMKASSLQIDCLGILVTLPETNIAPENRASQKETSIPTIHFQVPC